MIYVIGLGSMGRRRVRDLNVLGQAMVVTDLNRSLMNQCAVDYIDRVTAAPLHDLKVQEGDLVLICVPPDKHVEMVRHFNSLGAHVFCEAGIFPYSDGLYPAMAHPERFAPSCTMHFHPAMKAMRHVGNWLGRPLLATHHIGQDIRDWHPGADLTQYYAAQEATSGAKEMVAFELFWLREVVGHLHPTRASITVKQQGSVPIVDTILISGLADRGTSLSLTVDVVSPVPIRQTRIVYKDHVINWSDLSTPWIEVQPRGNGGVYQRIDGRPAGQDIPFDFERVYFREMQRLIDWSRGEDDWPMTLTDYERVVGIVEKLR